MRILQRLALNVSRLSLMFTFMSVNSFDVRSKLVIFLAHQFDLHGVSVGFILIPPYWC